MMFWSGLKNNSDNGLLALAHRMMHITIKLVPSAWNEKITICPMLNCHYYFIPGGLGYGF